MFKPLLFLAALSFVLPAHAEIQVQGQPPVDRIQPQVFVLSADWRPRLPPHDAVNAPEFLTTVYPGQHVALGILAAGPHRHSRLEQLRITARYGVGGGAETLRPVAIRDLKAEGADFALGALQAAGIADQDRAQLQAATTLVTIAVFEPAWSVPVGGDAHSVAIAVTANGNADAPPLAPATLRVRADADWLKEPLMDRQACGRFLTRYHPGLGAGQLLHLFQSVASDGTLAAGPAEAYFALQFQQDGAARDAAMRLYPHLDATSQRALTWILRRAGMDAAKLGSTLSPALSSDAVVALQTIPALHDPRALPQFRDPVAVEAVRAIGAQMDQCWAGWMATGDVSYLRPLVELLNGAPDYPSLVAWQKARTGAKGLNASVARGLAYQIAGWSIGSFQRTDPLVADWLAYWAKDPAVSATVRREIARLPSNPEFRRK